MTDAESSRRDQELLRWADELDVARLRLIKQAEGLQELAEQVRAMGRGNDASR